MSHIIKNKEDIIFISEQLDILRKKGYSKYTINEILEKIIPENEQYQVTPEIEDYGYPAYFSAYFKKIHISLVDLEKFINKTIDELIEYSPYLEKHRNELFFYLIMITLCHEVEHEYQYMIGQEFVDNPYQLVVQCYKNISNIRYDQNIHPILTNILISRYRLKKDSPKFVLERNANLEAYELMKKVSQYEQNLDINRFTSIQHLIYSANGYLKMKNNGSFEESYKNIWRNNVFKSFDHTEEIPVEDRIRYGLPIDNHSRKVLLKKFSSLKEK